MGGRGFYSYHCTGLSIELKTTNLHFSDLADSQKYILYMYSIAAIPICAVVSGVCALSARALKVHKIENFFGSDFEFCVISLLVMLKY